LNPGLVGDADAYGAIWARTVIGLAL
jgi:hypothetical protein